MKVSIITLVWAATAVAVAEPKAMTFGAPTQVQALRPRLELVKHLLELNTTGPTYVESLMPQVKPVVKTIHDEVGERDDYDVDDDDEEEEEEEEEEEDGIHMGFSPNSITPRDLFKPEKRMTRDCGVFVLDCAYSPQICNNACYYQNCVNKDQTLRYQDYGGNREVNAENRVDAGTTVSDGTPCRNMPLSQKMYDTWPGWAVSDPGLQTDEWPMAAMQQPDFNDLDDGTVRNTLRCIPFRGNSRGGNQYSSFRNQKGRYSKKKPGKYADKRTCDSPQVFTGDETFTVEFDLSDFENDEEIQEVVPYCMSDPDCTNDGRQFHLSTLRYVTNAGKAGRMSWIYDLDTMNNYILTGENDPIESFQVVVKLTGDDRTTFAATVSKYRNSKIEEFGTASNDNLATDQTLTVSGLPRDLQITPKSDAEGQRLDFIYGDPGNVDDRLAWFSFNTNDKGYDNEFDDENSYCKLTDLKDDDDDIYGQQYECWFPGW